MYINISLHRGLDLRLQGAVADGTPRRTVKTQRVAMVPDDFPGFTPRVAVKAGDRIEAGQALMTDKINPSIAIVTPVSGTVEEVVRGDRRKVMRIVVKADADATATAKTGKPSADASAIKEALMKSGLWAMMRQLPYDIIPDAETVPRDIFITSFDSAPLATSLSRRTEGKTKELKAGIEALSLLTTGNIYIGMRDETLAKELNISADGSSKAVAVIVNGPHPAGLPSVQIANTAPVDKGQTVWMLDTETLARIGSVMTEGICDWSTVVALTGSEVTTPCEIVTTVGAEIAPLAEGNISTDSANKRFIAGNVLTGINAGRNGFLHYPYRQITVIPEGDDVDEFMGWASLSPKKMSYSRSFLSRLLPGRMFAPDARLNGGRRAMIMSGLYEKMLPMDIMAEHLIKAVMVRDIDRMEALGIYEVTPADFALCEYVDPSKLELQKTVREGLDYLRKELS